MCWKSSTVASADKLFADFMHTLRAPQNKPHLFISEQILYEYLTIHTRSLSISTFHSHLSVLYATLTLAYLNKLSTTSALSKCMVQKSVSPFLDVSDELPTNRRLHSTPEIPLIPLVPLFFQFPHFVGPLKNHVEIFTRKWNVTVRGWNMYKGRS